MNGIEYNNDGTKAISAQAPKRHVVTSAEATAEIITVDVSDMCKGTPSFYIIQIYRAGVPLAIDATVTTSAGTVTITEKVSTPSYEVTADDVVMVLAVG